MKILVLTPFLPYAGAPAGCPRAVFDRLCLLLPHHAVTVVTFAEPEERSHAAELRQCGAQVYALPRTSAARQSALGLWRKRLRLAAGLFNPARPMLVQEFYSPAAARLVRRLLREPFDLILVEHVLMGQYLAAIPAEVPVVFTEHDVRLALDPAPLGAGNGLRDRLAALERRKWHAYETWVCRRARAVLVPTVEDARLLAGAVPGIRPLVVPFGLAATSTLVSETQERDPTSLLFVGNFSHPPNVDAARWLCEAILPRVRAQRPDVALWLVGRDPPQEVRALAGAAVHVTGAVPSVAPYLARCGLFVAPLRRGGGMRMKVIEALAAGIPVVTTRLGAQGLDAVPGRHLLVAGGADAFAATILSALADRELRERLGQGGQAWARTQDRPAERLARLTAILESVLAPPLLLESCMVRQTHSAPGLADAPRAPAAAPRVSIIIPSWTGDVTRLRQSIDRQTFRDYEIDVVRGVSPAARARNAGAARARGEILLFIDDDAFFGHARVLETLVDVLDRDPRTAVAGTSKLAPRAATPLQRRIARQVPRTIYPVVPADIESNPPLNQYGFTAISTTCCAVRRSVFDEVGGFDERLTTGPEDTEFFYRIRRHGYRLVVAGNTWVYHDPPASVRDLLRKSFWYGLGHALEARKNPERGMAVLPLNRWYGLILLIAALLAFPAAFLVHFYFDPVRRVVVGFRPLKTLSTYAVLCGYVYGWYHGPPRVPAQTYMGRPAGGTQPSGPRRVLYVDAYPQIGGGQQVLFALVTRLPRDRYAPLVALPPGNPLRARLDAAGVRTVDIEFKDSNYTMPSLLRPLSLVLTARSIVVMIRALVTLARREQVDLIHANSAVVGVHVIPAAAWLGVPCVVHAHDFNTAHLTNGILTLLLHYRQAALIFVSQALARHYGPGRRRYCHRVIHNGVDTALFHPAAGARARLLAELGLSPDCFLIAAVGRLEHWKGFDLAIAAFATVAASHPQARLIVVGDAVFGHLGAIKDELVALAQRLGVADKVIFTGFRSNIPETMAGIDLLVHCPRDPEAFGMVLTEAMACARPIVTVAAGGAVEQVADGVNGLLVPVGDVPALAAAMTRLIGDPALARRMGDAGLRICCERLTVERFVAGVERFYDDVLARAEPVATPAAGALASDALGQQA